MTIQPIGSIIAYPGQKAPDGWLMCDGSAIPSDKAHKALIDLVGPKTPDLRGYFLRGLDPGGTIDADKGRKLLSVQADGVGPHTHSYNRWYHKAAGKSGADPTDVAADNDSPNTSGPTPATGETRPKNVAVNFIIKATDEGR